MNFLKNIADQLQQLWRSGNALQRAWFVVLALGAVVAVGSVGWWSSRPQYIPLVSNLSPGQAAEVVSKVEAAGIRTDMNFAGTSVLVPKQDFGKARMAAGDVAAEASEVGDSFAGSLLSDPAMSRYRVLQAKERQIEASLIRMKAIASADVQIAQPEWTPFARQRSEVTASVVLGVRQGVSFSAQQATTIAAAVASSVEGLNKENVTVSDLNGTILAGKGMHQGAFSSQVEYRHLVENDLASKAEELLTRMLGEGKAAVRVTADIDFTQTERVETIYDPDGQVVKREKVETTKNSQASRGASGVAGIQGNSASSVQYASPQTSDTENSEIDYLLAQTTDTTTIVGGDIIRLTVAAMVDLTPPADDPNSSIAALDKTQIESVIKQAVGLDTTRGDAIEVLYTSLAASAVVGPSLVETIDTWQFYTEIVRHASLGLAALVAMVIAFLIIKKVRPLPAPAEPDNSFDAERSRLMAELASQARDNPEIVSRIVEAWMEVPDSRDGSQSKSSGTATRRAA